MSLLAIDLRLGVYIYSLLLIKDKVNINTWNNTISIYQYMHSVIEFW